MLVGTLYEQKDGRYRPSHCSADKGHKPLDDLLRLLFAKGYAEAVLVKRDGTVKRVSIGSMER